MLGRYTLPQLIMESQETLRYDGIKRRSSGFRYWLGIPLAPFLIYGAALWAAVVLVFSTVAGPEFISHFKRR